jgi:hypothetical protein
MFAVAPAGFIFGVANRSSAEGTSLLGGFGGMPPEKILNFGCLKPHFLKVLINHFFSRSEHK